MKKFQQTERICKVRLIGGRQFVVFPSAVQWIRQLAGRKYYLVADEGSIRLIPPTMGKRFPANRYCLNRDAMVRRNTGWSRRLMGLRP